MGGRIPLLLSLAPSLSADLTTTITISAPPGVGRGGWGVGESTISACFFSVEVSAPPKLVCRFPYDLLCVSECEEKEATHSLLLNPPSLVPLRGQEGAGEAASLGLGFRLGLG